MEPRRFRIALSFAGEKRDFVEQVAAILARRFGETAILYDKYHEAEFARHDLGLYLPKLYGQQSDLIVPVLCPNYDAKRWTGWEWLHIYGLLTKSDGRRVMPARFGHAEVDGLSHAAAFIELDDKTPDDFSLLILERLALNEGKPKDYYTKRASPGDKAPHTSIPHNLQRLQPFKGIFISYRRDEASAYAGRLYDQLAARFGREQVFIDTANVGWGEDFVDVITEAAESCAVMIVLVSRQWVRGPSAHAESDDYVRLEVAKALRRKIRVIPILIQGAALPTATELSEDLSPLLRRNALALSDARWERDVEDLTKTLEGLLKD